MSSFPSENLVKFSPPIGLAEKFSCREASKSQKGDEGEKLSH